jgi:hypothetical protein
MSDRLTHAAVLDAFQRNGTDKGKYAAPYAFWFSQIHPKRILEIGVWQGGGMQSLLEFFPNAEVYGIEIEEVPFLNVFRGSQDNPEFLQGVNALVGGFDLIIDDGSHFWSHQRKSFQTLFPLLHSGGMYIIEDLETSYWPDKDWGGDSKTPFTKDIKELVDVVNKEVTNEQSIAAVHLYPRLCIIEKVL